MLENVNQRLPPGAPQIPAGAQIRDLRPSQIGGVQRGVEFIFRNGDGARVRVWIHGSDGTAPPGSNAATGDVLRLQVGGRYMDSSGSLHPSGIYKPNSPYYDKALDNDIHIPRQP